MNKYKYKTPEDITEKINKFISENKRYTKNQLAEFLGFKKAQSLYDTMNRKGFENIIENCSFTDLRRSEKPIIKQVHFIKPIEKIDLKKYADSIESELKAYCMSKKVRRLVKLHKS